MRAAGHIRPAPRQEGECAMQAREELFAQIEELKAQKDAVILAHYYTDDDVQNVADYVGDSFGLSKLAAELPCKTLVFAGVHFMGESAKLLSPDKTVLLPAPDADCPMAHMVDPAFVRQVREEYQDLAVVCYVNSTAETKALSDVCVTSSNALKVVGALPQKNILFVPDKHLGRFVSEQLPEKNFILNPGYCPIHDAVQAQEVADLKTAYPQAMILAHPECGPEVLALADYAGSTAGIIKQVAASDLQDFIIVTVEGIACQIRKETEGSGKRLHFPATTPRCTDMDKITLEGIRNALRDGLGEVSLPDESCCERARASLVRMLELS